MAKKKKIEEILSLETILFNCLECFRSNISFNGNRDLLLTLVFLRFIGEKFEDEQQAFVPKEVRWDYLMLQSSTKLNGTLNGGLQALEDSEDALKGCVRLGPFCSINLEANVIKKVVDEANKISHEAFGTECDLMAAFTNTSLSCLPSLRLGRHVYAMCQVYVREKRLHHAGECVWTERPIPLLSDR
jgi:hypothetical protein